MTGVQLLPPAADTDVHSHCETLASRAAEAAAALPLAGTRTKDAFLRAAADAIERATEEILAANGLDIAAAPGFGLTDASIDRLRLDRGRVGAIADGLRGVAALPDPVGEVIESFRRPNGLKVSKVRVPLGVVFFIYESRPNVTADAAAICLKSGNAVILRGGKEAAHSSRAIVDVLQRTLGHFDLPASAIQLVGTADRSAVGKLLTMSDRIDVAIPRGGRGLIERVTAEARMPVIKHFDGNCHVYLDVSADLEMAAAIVENAKCQRMGVCNALESLVVHREAAARLLPELYRRLQRYQIEWRADAEAAAHIPGSVAATEEDWSTEYLGPILSVKTVGSVAEAITHINRYGSHHSDAIVGNDYAAIERFLAAVDSAAVLVNASTRFNDGGELGFGAEIGISTDKFHARGPCGLRELTSYKYIIRGDGQVR